MPNQIAKDKQGISLVIEKKLIAMLDNEAKIKGTSRTAIIVRAIREHFKLDPIPASASQIEDIKNALVLLAQDQKILMSSIQETPQTLALPSPEIEELKNMNWWQFRKWKKGNNG